MDEVRIVYTPVHELKAWNRNPKKHDLPNIRASLRRFGFVAPIVLDDRTHRIVAGHGRLEALVAMHAEGEPPPKRVIVKDGRWLAPVLRGADFADEKEAEAYLVADNFLTQNAGWEEAELAAMLENIGDLAGTGVDEAKLAELNRAAASALDDLPDIDVPAPLEVTVKPGASMTPTEKSHRAGAGETGAKAQRVARSARVQIGAFFFDVEMAEFKAWEESIRQSAGFTKDALEAEVRKRLGLPAAGGGE